LPITGTNGDFAVARYHANGAPDTSFGSAGTGRVSTDIAGGYDIAKNVVIENSGTILVTGVISMGSSSVLGHTGLARYTAAGVLDSSLNQDGIHTLPDLSLGEGLLLQGDGRMLVAGNVTVANEIVFGVMRLEADGAADVSFGSRGLASARFSALFDTARDVVLDASGRILLSGQASNYSNPNFAVARFTSAGVLDTSFDTDGMFTIDFFGLSDSAENIAVQTDGKIVLGGFAVNNASLRFGLARVNP
jgi:uncharacterized delta-60 repeat protein